MTHVFVDKIKQHKELAEQLFEKSTVKGFMAALKKIATTEEAIYAWEAGDYKDYEGEDSISWKCFGFGTEVLAEYYLTMFGPSCHNLIFDRSVEDIDSTELDIGIDHFGSTSKDHKVTPKKMPRLAKAGAPVYIQTKGTTNHVKEHKTNDGSRILNFLAVAQVQAQIEQCSYQARYVVVTTAKGLHYKMEDNTNHIMEVIGYKQLSKMIDKNEMFWNRMRRDFGLQEKDISVKDALAVDAERQLEEFDKNS